jgi:hypothetical protein
MLWMAESPWRRSGVGPGTEPQKQGALRAGRVK